MKKKGQATKTKHPTYGNNFKVLENLEEDNTDITATHATEEPDKDKVQHEAQNKGKRPKPMEYVDPKEPQPQDEDAPMIEEEYFADLGGLDLVAIEDACRRYATNSIPDNQIHLLVEGLQNVKVKLKLRVQTITNKDSKKCSKEFKKRGRKSTLQRLDDLGCKMMESGRHKKILEI